jgi:hypothetical protein
MRKFDAYKKEDPGNNGLNNASILTFSKDVVNALIKELTQNSIDAKEDGIKKVRIKVNMHEVDVSEIEGLDGLSEILDQMSEFWTKENQQDFVKFFKNASERISSGKLHVFSFEDFDTKGLDGDENSGSFKRLVYDEGVSDYKPDNALGGFGIGKNSFFALTALQTVFYSSFHSQRGHMFFGVTKLAEYVCLDNFKRNNRVYYGDWDNNRVKHVTDINLIPNMFKRTENGLSSYALGVVFDPEWKKQVIQALIRNYWFLFEKDEIEAEVDGEVIDKDSYLNYASQFFAKDDSILAFIESYRNPGYINSYNIHEIGGIKILLSEEPAGSNIVFPDKIVFIRDGMMIKEYPVRTRNLPNRIAGIIYCDNPKGNKILSKMEPPAHNDFESYYLPKKHPTLTIEDGEKIIKEIDDSRRRAISALKDNYNKPTKQVGFIDELLSGLSVSTGHGNSQGNNSKSDQEEFEIAKKEGDLEFSLSSFLPNNVSLKDDNDGNEVSNRKKNSEDTEQEPKTVVEIEPKPAPKPKLSKSKKKEAISKAKFYFSHEESGYNHYVLIVNVNSDMENASLKFTQHGDSPAKAVSTELIEVLNGTKKFKVIKHGNFYEITGLKLKANLKNKYDVIFKEDYTSAFKILN